MSVIERPASQLGTESVQVSLPVVPGVSLPGERSGSVGLQSTAPRKSSWGASASVITVLTVFISLGNYLYSFIVVHLMGPRDFSRFSAAQGLMLVLGSGCMAAIPWAMARFIAERDDRRARQEALHFGLIASAVQGLVFAVVAGGILWLEAGAAVGITVAISALFGSMIAVPVGFLQGVDRIGAIAVLRILEFLVRFGSGIVVLVLVSRSASAALIGYPIGAVVLMLAGLSLCRSGLPPAGGEQHTIRALVKESANLGAIQVFLSMLGALDTVAALAAHLGTDPTASYQSAALLGRIPIFLSAAIGLAAYVHVVKARNDAEVRDKLGQAVRLYSIVVIPMVIACVTVPGTLLHVLIPSSYGDAGTLLRFTAISGAAVGWIDVVSTAHQARARFRPAIRILGIAAVAQPIVLICAGRTAGIWVFAVGLIAVSLTAAGFLSFDARAWLMNRMPLRGVAFSVAALALAWLLHDHAAGWIVLIAVIGAVAVRALVMEIRQTQHPSPEADASLRSEQEVELSPQPEPEPRPRVLIVGDSFIVGLGVYGHSFGKLAAEELDAAEVLDLSGISKSVGDTLSADTDRIRDFAPDLAILACGSTESLVHPGLAVKYVIERWGPSAWNGVAGLEPRPYFSGGWRRRLRQRISSWAKVTVKRATIRMGGGRRIPVDSYRDSLRTMIAMLEDLDCKMVFIGMTRTDEHLFPFTNASMADTQAVLEAQTAGRPDTALIDMLTTVHYWDDFLRDRLHMADQGHQRVAEAVVLASRSLMDSDRVAVPSAVR